MSEKLYIIKIGGDIIDNDTSLGNFLKDFSQIPEKKILVHGGGKIATEVASKLGIKAKLVDGRRITDEAMVDVVTMVYGGRVNRSIVAKLQALGVNSLGLTGADGAIIRSVKRPVGAIDYGFVGDIEFVDASRVTSFLNLALTPVLAPITYAANGHLLNTNADTIASTVSLSLSHNFESHLIYCFEKKGVLANPHDEESIIPKLSRARYLALLKDGIITKGMMPKLQTAFQALEQGVQSVTICHAADLQRAVQGSSGTALVL